MINTKRIDYILGNAKWSMEMEGFIIEPELEEIGRKILIGELNLNDYKAQIKQEAMRYANEV